MSFIFESEVIHTTGQRQVIRLQFSHSEVNIVNGMVASLELHAIGDDHNLYWTMNKDGVLLEDLTWYEENAGEAD